MDYRAFECVSELDGTVYKCYFLFLQTAISLRHSDTVDVRFMISGKRITVALPHVAFVEFAKSTGRVLTDDAAAEIAAQFLKEQLEKGGDVEDLLVPIDRVLHMAGAGAATVTDVNPPGTQVPGSYGYG